MPNSVNRATPAAAATILVIESDVLIRISVCSYLKACGFRVIEAANAEEALPVLQELLLPVDIVLSDVGLSGMMNGFALAQWVRAHKPGLPVLLVGTAAGAANAAVDLCTSSPLLSKSHRQAFSSSASTAFWPNASLNVTHPPEHSR